MTTLIETPVARLVGGECPEGGLTLEERLARGLEDVRVEGRAECPLCRGRLAPAGADRARCTDCGSEIS
jgi:tRNA(Ile2) C34 agmatinyltransferase TiaS